MVRFGWERLTVFAAIVAGVFLAGCSGGPERAAAPITTVVGATNLPPSQRSQVESAVLTEMRASLVPGAALSISIGDRTFAEAFGVARVGLADAQTHADTNFRIGSLTKSVTAATVLALVQDGRVALDAPLSRYFPEYRRGAAVTVRELLNQTSGIPNYLARAEVTRALQAGTTLQVVDLIERLALTFTPGTRWEYSNSNYALLAALIERVTKVPYRRYVHERVLDLCKLRATSLPGEPDARGAAWGYTVLNDRLFRQPALPSLMLSGAAGIASNAPDLTRWEQCLTGNLLSPSMLAQMLAPVQFGREPVKYAMGLVRKQIDGVAVWWHDGLEPGFTTVMVMIPSRRINLAVLMNSDAPDPDPLGFRLARILLGRADIARKER